MELRRSILSLMSLCAVAVLITALGLVTLFAGATVVFAIGHRSGGVDDVGAPTMSFDDTAADSAGFAFSGVITDDRCVTRHDMGSNLSAAECSRMCVNHGGNYVIVSGDKKYYLAGRQDLAMLAGERVTVTGTLTGNTIHIKSIDSEK